MRLRADDALLFDLSWEIRGATELQTRERAREWDQLVADVEARVREFAARHGLEVTHG